MNDGASNNRPAIFAPVMRALNRAAVPSSDFDFDSTTRVPGRELRAAGVLVPLIERANGLQMILTKRASHLKHHPGQIAFPGGKQDPGDRDAIDAALREAEEEIGLTRRKVDVLGVLPTHETGTGFLMTPVLARVTEDFVPVPEAGEVEVVFEVPLAHVADPARFVVQSRYWGGTLRQYFTVPYGPYYIWGATARVLRSLADRMGE